MSFEHKTYPYEKYKRNIYDPYKHKLLMQRYFNAGQLLLLS